MSVASSVVGGLYIQYVTVAPHLSTDFSNNTPSPLTSPLPCPLLEFLSSGRTPMTFLFSDTQIINESFVEDINNMLNSGEVPNIFPNDERVAICEVNYATLLCVPPLGL